jgi:hypothetical protein
MVEYFSVKSKLECGRMLAGAWWKGGEAAGFGLCCPVCVCVCVRQGKPQERWILEFFCF